MPNQFQSQGKDSTTCRVYRQLIRFYPRHFRKEFGGPMELLFKDQWNAAYRSGSRWTRLAFWVHVLADTSRSVSREHLAQLRGLLSEPWAKHFTRHPGLAFVATFLAISALVSATIYAAISVVPPVYSSTARVAVGDQRSNEGGYDPYFIQTEFEKLQSRSVLNTVIGELNMNHWLAQQQGDSIYIPSGGAYRLLREMIQLRQSRNTSLIEIRVRAPDQGAAAEIANKIAEVYRRTTKAAARGWSVEIVDPAERALRPVSPNLPLNLCLGWLLSAVFAGVMVWVIRLRYARSAGADNLSSSANPSSCNPCP